MWVLVRKSTGTPRVIRGQNCTEFLLILFSQLLGSTTVIFTVPKHHSTPVYPPKSREIDSRQKRSFLITATGSHAAQAGLELPCSWGGIPRAGILGLCHIWFNLALGMYAGRSNLSLHCKHNVTSCLQILQPLLSGHDRPQLLSVNQNKFLLPELVFSRYLFCHGNKTENYNSTHKHV